MAASSKPELSATELELKRRGRRRLVGAITIGLLAVVFLPMIFDSEPKRAGQAVKTQDISVQVPSKEGQPALPPPAAAPVVVPPAPATTPPPAAATTPPPAATATPAPAPATTPPPKVASVVTEPAKTPPAKDTPKSATKPDKVAKAEPTAPADKTGFVVQLGVFGDADNAKQAIAKMKEAKLAVYTESIPIKTGTATRVRIGPFPTREKADSVLAQVKLAGADGKIVPLK